MRKPVHISPLDTEYRPCVLEMKRYSKILSEVGIALERNSGCVSVFTAYIDPANDINTSKLYIERLVKTLLWVRGGWKIYISGPDYICEHIQEAYMQGGLRDFDRKVMERIYEKRFEVEKRELGTLPLQKEEPKSIGRHLSGYRIGFDAGGSDRKVSAVANGEVIYSEEVIWNPKTESDPAYHYAGIVDSINRAAKNLPVVDAIGVSAAGVYVDNRVMIASLFMSVPDDVFEKEVKDIFLKIAREMGNVPIEVANDGDVTALAGAMELDDTNVLGIAMGTSQAGGYADGKGNITGWLNELAFVPVDLNPASPVDEWSGDHGCGVKYFSQDAVIRLAEKAGISLDPKDTPAARLKQVQELHESGDPRTPWIYKTIGIYLGYSIAWYAEFYDLRHVLILGRVTSGEGGTIILKEAEAVLHDEFPELYSQVKLHMPDEKNKRVGQSIAAASLADI